MRTIEPIELDPAVEFGIKVWVNIMTYSDSDWERESMLLRAFRGCDRNDPAAVLSENPDDAAARTFTFRAVERISMHFAQTLNLFGTKRPNSKKRPKIHKTL